jgi:hypothetical protein
MNRLFLMLRASWRPLLVMAAVAVLRGSTAHAPMQSVDAPGKASVPVAQAAAIGSELPASSGNPIAEVRFDRLSETRDRPVFSPSRRPPPPPALPAVAARVERAPQAVPVSPPGVALFGIVVGEQGARAFIATGADGQIIGVRPGDDVSGWTVSAITQRNLVLSHAERSATFTLFSPGNVSQTKRPDATATVANPQVTRTTDAPHPRIRVR